MWKHEIQNLVVVCISVLISFLGKQTEGLGFNNEVNMKAEWFIGVPLKTMNLVSWACESASCWESEWRKNPNWRQDWEWRVKSESERESFGYIYKKIVWSLKKLLAVTFIWYIQIVS